MPRRKKLPDTFTISVPLESDEIAICINNNLDGARRNYIETYDYMAEPPYSLNTKIEAEMLKHVDTKALHKAFVYETDDKSDVDVYFQFLTMYSAETTIRIDNNVVMADITYSLQI